MGLDKKADALLSLNLDVAVVPECSAKSATALQHRGFNTLWFGSNPHKGLGVICRQEWPIRALPQPEQKWIAPIVVDAPTPFTLLAVWACVAGEKRSDRYIGQVYQALVAHPEWFSGSPVVIAGDFNSNKIWDAKREVGNHSAVVKLLDERGLVSTYHEHFCEPQGEESHRTLYMFRREDKPYHIDYIFIPREWAPRLQTVEVGRYEQWSKLSDHCPVIVEVAELPTVLPEEKP
jgi:exodeoxyribonuclease III